MYKVVDSLGRIAGIAGLLVCLSSVLLRLFGSYYLLGVPTVTLFLGGLGLMVSACYLKLEALSFSGESPASR